MRATCSNAPRPERPRREWSSAAQAKTLLRQIDIEIVSHILQIGTARTKSSDRPLPSDRAAVDASEVRCFDSAAEALMIDEIKAAAKVGDSLGGIAEVLAYNVPVGLGSHVHWDVKIDGLLAQALMSIQAVKGVEIGDGFELSGLRDPRRTTRSSTTPRPASCVEPRTRAASKAASRWAVW